MTTGYTILVSAFANINGESNSRVLSIFNQIQTEKKVITTDFNHVTKSYYVPGDADNDKQMLLHVPAYSKNISPMRIWSHLVFAWKLRNYLRSLTEKPKSIYCTMPTSASAYICARYCKKNGVKFVIDVIDLWPESLLPFVKGEAIIKVMLAPWTYLTRYAYKSADVILGESVKYAQEAKRFNNNAEVYPLYLGVDMGIVEKVKEQQPVKTEKPENEIWIAYAGSLGTSYDFNTLLEAVNSIHGKYQYKLWLVGDGVRHEEIADYIATNGLNAEITGFVPYKQLLGYLSYCDIVVNIFRNNTKVVYSYKFNDYVSMGCFVLNSLEGETAEMVDKYAIGRNFNFNDKPLQEVLKDVLDNWNFYSGWRKNCQRLIDEKLDKSKIYTVVKDIFD